MSVFKKYIADTQAPCPKCRESISQLATICPHYKSNLEEDPNWLAAQSREKNNTSSGCTAILLLSLTAIVGLTKLTTWLIA